MFETAFGNADASVPTDRGNEHQEDIGFIIPIPACRVLCSNPALPPHQISALAVALN